MPANTAPIFTAVPDIQWGSADGNGGTPGPLKTANTAVDGTGTVLTVFTAGPNGSYVRRLTCRAAGTNGATVLRIFINNGSTNATIANNILIGEMTLSATTANAAAALQDFSYSLDFALPAGYKIQVTLGATVVAGVWVAAVGGDY